MRRDKCLGIDFKDSISFFRPRNLKGQHIRFPAADFRHRLGGDEPFPFLAQLGGKRLMLAHLFPQGLFCERAFSDVDAGD
jgi:hypothetical protein